MASKNTSAGTLKNPVKVMKRVMKAGIEKADRAALKYAHLDEDGGVAATDSYRLYEEHGVWDGPSIEVPADLAKAISRYKSQPSAEIWEEGDCVHVRMADGAEFHSRSMGATYPNAKFPNYKQLRQGEYFTVAYLKPKELLPVVREHVKQKTGHVVIEVLGHHMHLFGGCGESRPEVTVKESCDGDAVRIGFNPVYLRDALVSFDAELVELRITKPLKPATICADGMSVLLMPVRMDEPSAKGMKQAPKSEEPKIASEVGSLKGERVCITGKLAGMTRSEAFSRLKLAGGTPSEKFTSKVTMLVIGADAGNDKRKRAECAIEEGKVKVVSGTEFVKALMKQGKTAGEKKMEEHMAKKVEKVNREGLSELLYALAIDRAAKEPDNRLTEGNASPNSATYVWRLQKEGRLKKEEHGEFTSWYLDGDFITCIERRYSQRKVRLHYPEIKPAQHKEDVVMKRRTEQKLTEHGVKAEVKVAKVDDGITAVTIEPPKPEKKQPPKAPAKPKEKEDEGMKKRIAELEAQLKATRAELETVWKENEVLKAKPEPKPVEVAATVSLSALTEQMQAWCKDRENVSARRKNEQLCTPVRVEGDTKPYKEELTELGFRYSKKGFWYYGEKEAQKQGKRVVA